MCYLSVLTQRLTFSPLVMIKYLYHLYLIYSYLLKKLFYYIAFCYITRFNLMLMITLSCTSIQIEKFCKILF